MSRRRSPLNVREARNGWAVPCTICSSVPTRWRIALPEPTGQGRLTAFFCERHEVNKDMLVAGILQAED